MAMDDDFFQKLSESPDEERSKFFAGLDDAKKQEVVDGARAWKAKSTGTPQLDVGSIQMNGPVPDEVPERSLLDKATGAFKAVASLDPLSLITPGLNEVETVKALVKGWRGEPNKTGLQSVQKDMNDATVGLAEKGLKYNRENNPMAKAFPMGELYSRSLLSNITGDKILDNLPLDGVNQAEKYLGTAGTAYTMAATQLAGDPTNYIPAGEGAKGVKAGMEVAEKGLPKLVNYGKSLIKPTLQNAILGYGSGYIKGEDPLTTALTAAGATPVIHTAALGVGMGIKKGAELFGKAKNKIVETIGVNGDSAKELWSGLKETLINTSHPDVDRALLMENLGNNNVPEGFIPGKITDRNFRPTAGVIVKDGDDLVAHIVDYSINGDKRIDSIPIKSEEDAARLGNYFKEHKLPISAGDAAGLPEEQFKALFPDTIKPGLEVGDYAPSANGSSRKGKVVSQSSVDKTNPGRGRFVSEGGLLPDAPNPDHPPVGGLDDSPNVDLHVQADGHVRAEYVAPETPDQLDYSSASPVSLDSRGKSFEPVDTPDKTPAIPALQIKKEAGGGPPKYGYIKGPDGQYEVIRVLHEDPKAVYSDYNDIVEDGAGNRKTVRTVDIHPIMDTAESLSLSPELVRVPREQFVGVNPKMIQDTNLLKDTVQNIVRRNPSMGQKLFGKIWSPHHLGPRDMADLIRSFQGSEQMMSMKQDMLHAIGKHIGGPAGIEGKLDKELTGLFSGKETFEQLRARNPGVSNELENLAKGFRQRSDFLQKELTAMGALSPNASTDDMDKYMTQMYYQYLFPNGKWASHAPIDVMENAVKEVVKAFDKSKKLYTPETAWAEVQNIMGAKDPEAAFRNSSLAKSGPYKNLLAREELPAWVKSAKGEVTSGALRAATTLATQESLYARFKLLHEISANPLYYSHGPQPHLWPEAVPNNKSLYGPLAGGYVSPEIYNNIIDLPKAQKLGGSLWSALASFRKGNLVASPKSHMSSMLENLDNAVLAGGLNWFKPRQAADYLRQAATILKDYHNDPTGSTGLGAVMREMKQFGADWVGRAELEIGKDSPYIKEVMRKLSANKDSDAFSLMKSFYEQTAGRYKGLIQKNGAAMDTGDRWVRVASYVALKDKFKNDPGRYLPNVPGNQINQEAAKLASRRINDSFMNASHLGKAQEFLREGAKGLFAPFSTANTEALRITGLIPFRMKEDPDLKWRMMAWKMLLGSGHAMFKYGLPTAAIAGATAALNGGNPIDAAKNSIDKTRAGFNSAYGQQTDQWKATHPEGTTIPLPVGDGNQVFMFDWNNYSTLAPLLAGHPDDGMMQRVLANTAMIPFKGGAGEEGMQNLLEGTGLIKGAGYDQRMKEGEAGIRTAADTLMKMGGVPAVIPQVLGAYKKTRYAGRYNDPISVGAAAASIPIKGIIGEVNPVAPTGFQSDLMENKQIMKDLMSSVTSYSVELKHDKSLTDAQRSELIKQKIEELKAQMMPGMQRELGSARERGNLMKSYREVKNK